MNLMEWSKSSVDYGRKLVNSAVEGAREGEDEFLDVQEEALAPYLGESARHAIRPAVLGACLGVLGACVGSGRPSGARVVVGALLGGALGFGAGLLLADRVKKDRRKKVGWCLFLSGLASTVPIAVHLFGKKQNDKLDS